MYKLFLTLFLTCSLCSYADITDPPVEIDFKDPLSLDLSPALTLNEEINYRNEGDVVVLTNRTITCGLVTLSFGVGDAQEGVTFNHFVDIDRETGDTLTSLYTISVRRYATMTIQAPGCNLKSIVFNGDIGALSVARSGEGSLNTITKAWSPGNDNAVPISSVTFKNGANANTRIEKITVTYTRPPKPLEWVSTVPQDGSILSQSVSSVRLTFNMPVKIASAEDITLSSTALAVPKTLSPLVSGNVVTLSSAEPLSQSGIYSLNVPYGKFSNEEGSLSEAIKSKFQIRVPMVLDSVMPRSGKLTALPDTVHLYFAKDVKLDETVNGSLAQNGIIVGSVNLSVDPENKKHVYAKTENLTGDLGTECLWTVVIPEKAIHSVWYGTNGDLDEWNNRILIDYQVEKENHDKMAEAKKLIAITGVGYPAKGSVGRDSLQNVISRDGSSKELADAIAAFINEKNVALPDSGSWYKIVGVNNPSGDTAVHKVYLRYTDDCKVVLTTTAKYASPFEANVSKDGKVSFKTADGRRFLHVLTNSSAFAGTTPDNVSSTLGAVNWLNLSKLCAEGVDSILTFGKMTISGMLGRDIETQSIDAVSTAAIDHHSVSIVDSPTEMTYFDDEKSSAFLFELAVKPDTISPTAYLLSNEIERGEDNLVLVVGNVDRTFVADASKPYYMKNGEKASFSNTIISPTEVNNRFNVNTTGLSKGEYSLVIPQGTFRYECEGKTVEDDDMVFNFNIKYGAGTEPNPDFSYSYDLISWLESNIRNSNGIEYISDVDLNDMVLFSQINSPYSGLYADTTAQVDIHAYADNRVLRTGHFRPYPEIDEILGESGYQAIKLVLDEPIKPGELDRHPGVYVYGIPPGTYGNAEFAQYLNGTYQEGVSGKIIVNSKPAMMVSVNNFWATASGDGSMESPYNAGAADKLSRDFDMMSRSYFYKGIVSSVTDTLYIENGKNASFYISDDGTDKLRFRFMDVYNLNNKRWDKNDTKIHAGDEVVIYGPLGAPSDDPQRTRPESRLYLYSINGITSGIDIVKTYRQDIDVIYDLNGRRVTDAPKPGIYLMNGKKKVIR